MKVTDCITCPKCQKPFLKGVANATFGKEYFCHKCHVYFGVNELVNQFGYDAADLFPAYPVTHANYKGWIVKSYWAVSMTNYSEFDGGEPLWASMAERDEAYEVVVNMYAGIGEMEAFEIWKEKFDNDYADLITTQECALDIGVQ